MQLIFLLFSWFWTCLDSSTTSVARFHAENTGIEGEIAALNGFIWVNLNFSHVNWTLFPANCSDGGLKYHIHTEWKYGDKQSTSAVDRMLDDCDYNHTGNHYDPWFACGSASASADCEHNGGCIPPSSVWSDNDDEDYICDPSDYDIVPYTCEVGDWSGKYGTLEIDPISHNVTRIDGSYWEVDRIILSPNANTEALFSIVIHCNTGERAFCAPILRGNSNEVSKDLTDNQIIEVDFSSPNLDNIAESSNEDDTLLYNSLVNNTVFNNFTVTFEKEGTFITFPNDNLDEIVSYCQYYEMYLYSNWNEMFINDIFYDYSINSLINCNVSEFDGIYDPSHTCINDSSSEYCTNGIRCYNTSNTITNYDCSTTTDYFGCAVGDISGRIGIIDINTTNAILYNVTEYNSSIVIDTYRKITLSDPKSPPLFLLADKALVLKCVDDEIIGTTTATTSNNNTDTSEQQPKIDNICAITVQTNGTLVILSLDTTEEPDTTMSPSQQPTMAPTEDDNDDDEGENEAASLDGGAIAGIVIGSIFGVLLIILAVFGWYRYCYNTTRYKSRATSPRAKALSTEDQETADAQLRQSALQSITSGTQSAASMSPKIQVQTSMDMDVEMGGTTTTTSASPKPPPTPPRPPAKKPSMS